MTALAQALAAHRRGDLAQAETLYRTIIRRERQNFDAHNLLGALFAQQMRFSDGLALLQKAVKLKPGSAGAHLNLGHTLAGLDRLTEAEAAYRSALALAPADLHALRALVKLLVKLNRVTDAEALLKDAIESAPTNAGFHAEMGEFQAAIGQADPAISSLRTALTLAPHLAQAQRRLAICLANEGQYIQSIPVLERYPQDIECLVALAKAYRASQEPAKAYATARQAEKLSPDNPELQLVIGSLEADLGQVDAAERRYSAVLASGRLEADALHALAAAGNVQLESVVGRRLVELAGDAEQHPVARRLIHFSLGYLKDRAGDYDQAFFHYEVAHAAGRAPFDVGAYMRFVDETIVSRFTAKLKPKASDRQHPVFIVGMPRSGTSLVEQIITSHPSANGAGELDEMRHAARTLGFNHRDVRIFAATLSALPERQLHELASTYLQSLEKRGHTARLITDKMPHNFELLGFISMVFPSARIIHCVRDAADTCVSIYTQNFGGDHPYADSLDTLGSYYCAYRRLMTHWSSVLGPSLLTVDYEELVKTPRENIERMLDFLDLGWDDGCLAFHTSARAVTTFSRDQVRQPVFTSSVGKWRRFEKHLNPLLTTLGEYAPK